LEPGNWISTDRQNRVGRIRAAKGILPVSHLFDLAAHELLEEIELVWSEVAN
jgi:hypothetical protein